MILSETSSCVTKNQIKLPTESQLHFLVRENERIHIKSSEENLQGLIHHLENIEIAIHSDFKRLQVNSQNNTSVESLTSIIWTHYVVVELPEAINKLKQFERDTSIRSLLDEIIFKVTTDRILTKKIQSINEFNPLNEEDLLSFYGRLCFLLAFYKIINFGCFLHRLQNKQPFIQHPIEDKVCNSAAPWINIVNEYLNVLHSFFYLDLTDESRNLLKKIKTKITYLTFTKNPPKKFLNKLNKCLKNEEIHLSNISTKWKKHLETFSLKIKQVLNNCEQLRYDVQTIFQHCQQHLQTQFSEFSQSSDFNRLKKTRNTFKTLLSKTLLKQTQTVDRKIRMTHEYGMRCISQAVKNLENELRTLFKNREFSNDAHDHDLMNWVKNISVINSSILDKNEEFPLYFLDDLSRILRQILEKQCEKLCDHAAQQFETIYLKTSQENERLISELKGIISSYQDKIEVTFRKRTLELKLHKRVYENFKKFIFQEIRAYETICAAAICKLDQIVDDCYNFQEHFILNMSCSSLSSANMLALKFLIKFQETKSRLLELRCITNGELMRKYTLVSSCINFYKNQRLIGNNELNNGSYHENEVKDYSEKLMDLCTRAKEKYWERIKMLENCVFNAVEKISDDYNQKTNVFSTTILEAKVISLIQLNLESAHMHFELVEKFSNEHLSGLKTAVSQIQPLLSTQTLDVEKLKTIFLKLWNRFEVYGNFYRFKSIVRLPQSKAKLFKATPLHHLFDPSGKISNNLNIFDLLGYQIGVQHKIAVKSYQNLYKVKQTENIRFLHKDLVGKDREELMAKVTFELKCKYLDLYFIQNHIKEFLVTMNQYYESFNIFANKAVSQMHTIVFQEYLNQHQAINEIDMQASLVKSLNIVYDDKMKNLGQTLNTIIDQIFSNSVFDLVCAAKFETTKEMYKVEPVAISFILATYKDISKSEWDKLNVSAVLIRETILPVTEETKSSSSSCLTL